MRSTTFAFSALASVASVYAESIYFTAQSEDKSLNFPISSIHEGAGINYFLGAEGGSGEVFDLENGVASNKQGNYEAHVGILGPYLASGPAVEAASLSFDGNAIDTNNFFACKNTNDPYRYSENSYIIAANDKNNATAPFADCTAVSILKSVVDSSSSSFASTASPSSSSAAPAISSSAWSNGTTVITDITVTGYTTYCPESTIVTITTCSQDKCAPHVITVSEATTLTVTEPCVVPTTYTTTPVIVTKTTQSKSVHESKSTVAAESQTAEASTFEGGAAKAAVGAAGVAGIIAMLI